MKKALLIFIFLFSLNSFSQEEENGRVYNNAELDKMPEFEGGLQAFYKFVSDNYKMPKVPGLKGKVFVTFVINKDGSVVDGKILRDIGHGTGQEALRVLKRSPKWKPGSLDGVPVRVLFSLPITIHTK